MEREKVFHWLHLKDFSSIVNFLKTEQKSIQDDPIIQNAISIFFNELIEMSDQQSPHQDITYIFTQLYMLQKGRLFSFSNEQLQLIVSQICKGTTDSKEAFHYALEFPTLPECKAIIESYESSQPKTVTHAQEDKIKISQVIPSASNLTTSIFKSNQERLFFLALRNCYPNYLIYPNIALSTIVNSVFIKEVLESAEMKFFYNTTVDFVIIDQFHDFKPILGIELDSKWHKLGGDQKDSLKNKIFKAAGLPLYRIEHLSKYKTIEEFEQAVLSITKSHSNNH